MIRKICSYFIIWNLVLQHTYSLCAYGMGVTVDDGSPRLIRQVRGITIPFGKEGYMREAEEVSRGVFREGGSFETPEELSFYLPEDLKSPDLLAQAEAKKKAADSLWKSAFLRKGAFGSEDELAFYIKDFAKTQQEIIADALAEKERQTFQKKDDSITEVKAQILPGQFIGIKEHVEAVKGEQALLKKLVAETKGEREGFKTRRDALFFAIRMGSSLRNDQDLKTMMDLRRQAYAVFNDHNQAMLTTWLPSSLLLGKDSGRKLVRGFKDFEEFCVYWTKGSYENAVHRKILIHMLWEMGGRDHFEHPEEISYYFGNQSFAFKEPTEEHPDLANFVKRFRKNKEMAALVDKVFEGNFVQRIPDDEV